MAKYLSMSAATVSMSDLQELEAELSWDAQALEYIRLLEQYGGDVQAALTALAQEYGVKAGALIQEADKAGRDFAGKVGQAAVDDLPNVAGNIAAAIATPKLGPGAIAVAYFVTIALKAAMNKK